MNQQPLEIYGDDCIGGYSLKVLNRSYIGPIAKVKRLGAQEAEIFLYPDIDGKTSLNSPIEVFSGSSSSINLGGFLCQSGYTNDPVFEEANPVVTAVVTIMFDQGPNANNLTVTSDASAPLICSNNFVYNSQWGLALNMDAGRSFTSSSMSDSFTAHYRVQFESLSTTKYFFKQSDNAIYAKMTNLYVDEAVGTDSSVVLVNEDYYSDYTTENITVPENQGQLITIEVDVTPNTLLDPPSFTIENLGWFHTALFYESTSIHVRRHKTNQMLSEDIESLNLKLKKFSPQSFYNLFAGAKAVFGMFSFAGLLNDNPVRIMRASRLYGDLNFIAYADVYANTSGYVDFDSPVSGVIAGGGSASSITNLGQFLGHPDYGDPASLGESDGAVNRWYSQGIQSSGDLYAESLYVSPNSSPRFYDSSTRTLDGASDDGICGLNFQRSFNDNTVNYLNINSPFEASSVLLVYRNLTGYVSSSTNNISGLTGHPLNEGISIFSKNGFPGFNDQSFQGGVGVYDLENYRGTTAGLDTDLHVVGLYLGTSPQTLVVDTQEYSVDGIRTTPLDGFPDSFKFEQVGAASGFPLRGNLLAAIYYQDDRFSQKQEMQDYMNILFGYQNIPTLPSIEGPYIAVHTVDVAENDPSSTDPFEIPVQLVSNPTYDSVAANDLLLVVLTYDARSNGDTSPGSTPLGWTKLFDLSTSNDTNLGSSVYYRVADGSEGVYANFEVNNSGQDIDQCVWNCFKIKGAATSGSILEYSTPLGAIDSEVVTASAISKGTSENNLALAFGAVDNGFAESWSIAGTGWAGVNKEVTRTGAPTVDDIVVAWSYKAAQDGTTTTENAVFTATTPGSYADGDKIAFQIMINE